MESTKNRHTGKGEDASTGGRGADTAFVGDIPVAVRPSAASTRGEEGGGDDAYVGKQAGVERLDRWNGESNTYRVTQV